MTPHFILNVYCWGFYWVSFLRLKELAKIESKNFHNVVILLHWELVDGCLKVKSLIRNLRFVIIHWVNFKGLARCCLVTYSLGTQITTGNLICAGCEHLSTYLE